jgi:hypothetical protein
MVRFCGESAYSPFMALTLQGRFVKRMKRVYGVNVVTRREWGSRFPHIYAWRLINRRAKHPADTVVQHITVTRQTDNFNTDMRLLESIGMDRFGSGVSYNLVVRMKDGKIGIGQPFKAKGTHTLNDKGVPGYSYDQNLVARAIAGLGMPGDGLSDRAREVIVAAMACMMDLRIITPDPDYDPHSKFAFKDCPTDAIRKEMLGILRDAKALHQRNKNR